MPGSVSASAAFSSKILRKPQAPVRPQDSMPRSMITDQLHKILGSRAFAQSERMTRFLRFSVERALDGQSQPKEYLLGVEVFDRKSSYDPRVDPIVRVEARRLRAKLKAYYEGDGREDLLVIELAVGGYAARFRERESLRRVEAPDSRAASIDSIAVLPFVNLGQHQEDEWFSDGLTEELIHALTKLPAMRVVAWTTAARLRDQQQDL